MALAFASSASLAVYLYLGGRERIATHVNLPAEATAGSTLALRVGAIFAVCAGIWGLTSGGRFARTSYIGSIVLIAVLIVGTDKFLWAGVPLSVVSPTFTGSLVLLTFPAAWRLASDRQILVAISPLVGLCALSIVTYVTKHQYLFPWYNRWGLVAVLVVAAGVALTTLSAWERVTLGSVGLLSVMMSSSRQGLLALLLLAGVALLRIRGLRSRLRGFAYALIGVGLVYSAVTASQRVEAVGGVTGSDGRNRLLHSAWSVLSHSPVFGLAGDKPNSNLTASLTSLGLGWSTSVHNFVLDVWLRGGLLSAVAAIVFMLAVIWPKHQRGRLTGIVLLPFFMLGSELLYVSDTAASLLIALAYGIGVSKGGSTQESTPLRRGPPSG